LSASAMNQWRKAGLTAMATSAATINNGISKRTP
jgi:hypothetical protein